MGTIKAKDQYFSMGVLNASKGKQKEKNSKQLEKRKSEKPKSSDGGSNPPKEKDKKIKRKPNAPISTRDGIHGYHA